MHGCEKIFCRTIFCRRKHYIDVCDNTYFILELPQICMQSLRKERIPREGGLGINYVLVVEDEVAWRISPWASPKSLRSEMS